MTATLAAELDTVGRARHMERVRTEYAHTKADHARVDGCDDCGAGLDPARPSGWEFDSIANILLCAPCVAEVLRHEAQLAGQAERTVCTKGLHDMTDKANHYHTNNGDGRKVLRCRECYRVMNKLRKARARDERRAAKAGL